VIITALHERLLNTLREHNLLRGSQIILAVSGGMDSMVMLHMYMRLQADLNIALHVASLDHGLRGEIGAADAKFVWETAQKWGISCTKNHVDVKTLAAEWKMSIEAAARRARYDFLAKVAVEQGTTQVFTAHHADDQAETVLMRIIRGTGVDGLAAMTWRAPMPYHPEVEVVRPMLNITRQEIMSYATEIDLPYSPDLTNEDVSFTRNRIRHEIMPRLKEINPNVVESINRLAQIAAGESAVLDEINAALTQFAEIKTNCVLLPREPYWNQLVSAARQRRYLHWAVGQLNPFSVEHETIGYENIERARLILRQGKTGTSVQLPGGLVARLTYSHLMIARQNAADRHESATQLLLTIGETHDIQLGRDVSLGNGWSIRVMWGDDPADGAACRLAIPDTLPAQKIRVRLRGRKRGDRFSPLGMDGKHKSVAAWMVDHKIPANVRDRVPIITINDKIAALLVTPNQWIIDEEFKIVDTSKSVLRIIITNLRVYAAP